MTDDKYKNKITPIPGSLVDATAVERGGADAGELASVQRAVADASTRAIPAPVIADAADATRRRQLINNIRTMQRAKVNVAIDSAVRGLWWGVAGQLVWEGFAWWLDTRRPDTATHDKTRPTTENKPRPAAGSETEPGSR